MGTEALSPDAEGFLAQIQQAQLGLNNVGKDCTAKSTMFGGRKVVVGGKKRSMAELYKHFSCLTDKGGGKLNDAMQALEALDTELTEKLKKEGKLSKAKSDRFPSRAKEKTMAAAKVYLQSQQQPALATTTAPAAPATTTAPETPVATSFKTPAERIVLLQEKHACKNQDELISVFLKMRTKKEPTQAKFDAFKSHWDTEWIEYFLLADRAGQLQMIKEHEQVLQQQAKMASMLEKHTKKEPTQKQVVAFTKYYTKHVDFISNLEMKDQKDFIIRYNKAQKMLANAENLDEAGESLIFLQNIIPIDDGS